MTGMSVDAACVAAVERTGALLESMGHRVEIAHPSALNGLLVQMFPSLTVIINASRPKTVRWLELLAGRPLREGDIEPELLAGARQGANVTPEQEAEAYEAIARAIAPVVAAWAAHDVLVTPTLRQPAWPLGKSTAADAGTFPFVFSLTGQPAMSLPMHWTSMGLPIGVQLVGALGCDDLLLDLATQLEEAQPWAHRWPQFALD
jgi:amidase